MIHPRITIGFLTLLTIIGSLSAGLSAHAFSITPTRYVITVDPGTTQSLTVKVINTEAKTVQVRALVSGLSQDSAGRPVFGETADPAISWVIPDKTVSTLSPAQSATLSYTLQIPPAAAPGSHYVALVVEGISVGTPESNSLSARLATLVSIQVAGTAREDVRATFDQHSELIITAPLFDFPLTLENKGNIEVALAGSLSISAPLTREKLSVPINPGNQLLAGSTRRLEYTAAAPSAWASFLPTEQPPAIAASPLLPTDTINNFRSVMRWPGPYDMTASITYGKSGQTAAAEFRIWYLPPWSIGVGVGALVLIALLGVGLRRLVTSA